MLEGKIAIVTGSSRGIGRAIAERLAADGAQVIVNFTRGAAAAREVVTAIEQAGGRAIAVQADVSRLDDVRRLFAAAERFGGVDIVVANAGETPDEDYEELFAINVRGTVYILREAARRIHDGGRIVTISTKAAADWLTRVLAHELGARAVTANIVSPGVTETDMLEATPQLRPLGLALSPLRRLGTPADIADVVAFLVGPAARWLTAQNIQATGGLT